MPDAVLDSSAVRAVLLGEPGSDHVELHLPYGKVSAVNLGEIVAKLHDLGMPEATTDALIARLRLDVRTHDVEAAVGAGHLRPMTRRAGSSLGDRACLELARALDLPALTADRSWLGVADAVGVRVDLIR
jgi:ribonuclease VapC